MGCDPALLLNTPLLSPFQFTHPHGVRPIVGVFLLIHQEFQFTHPHGVRLPRPLGEGVEGPVSIHAPAWGATVFAFVSFGIYGRFNSRTRMGCDDPDGQKIAQTVKFQFTHPHGVRRNHIICEAKMTVVSIHAPAWGATDSKPSLGQQIEVSIHAPAWGATQSLRGGLTRPNSFNSRTRMGCDVSIHSNANSCDMFQFTHPHGVRHT